MERSLYPNSVEVDQSQLAYTESTKSDQILKRTLALGQMGVVSGLRATVNQTNTQRIDVTVGRAYAPSGEELILAAAQIGLALADNTAGTENYAILTYTETEDLPEPNENGVDIENTRVTVAGVLSIVTATTYNGLTTDEQAKRAIVAIITGTGGTLEQANISQPQPFISVLAPSQPETISGVSITTIDFATSVGQGTLDFDASPANGSDPLIPAPRIRWKAPGEGSFGTYVGVSANGNYQLMSAAGRSIGIAVIAVNLPLIDQTETIRVDSLYAIPAPRFTAADYLHRTYVGSGTPSIRNPHGLTFEDLGGSPTGQVQEHQLFMHSNGIKKGSNSIFLLANVIPVSGPSPDYLSITGPISGDTYLVNGKVLFSLAENQITFLSSVSASISIYDILVDEGGHPLRALRLEHPSSPTLSGVAVVDIEDSFIAGVYNLEYDRTTKLMSFDGGPAVIIRGDGNYALYNEDGQKVIVNVGVSTNLGFGVLPVSGGPTFSDAITVQSKVSRTQNFLIGSVVWDGSNTLGFTELLVNPKTPVDKRLFGTSGLDTIRDDVTDREDYKGPVTYTVGDGRTTFGDFDGAGAIQVAINTLVDAATPGTIFVKAGTYDPFTVSGSDITLLAGSGVIIDGVSSSFTTGGCITVAASRCVIEGFRLQNAAVGVSQQSGNDNVGRGLIYESTLTTILGWTAGLRNRYDGNKRNIRTIAADTTLTPLDDIVMVNASAAARNITMPASAACLRGIKIKKIDTTVNLVSVLRAGSDTVDNMTVVGLDVYLDSETFEPISGGWIT